MAYSLVIAEDEQMMRNGLTKMIGWTELGFEVSAVFSDGSEVLSYLKQNIPDVLLMDIKMISVSGLEVAKFICENKLPVKVVLLSGYKSFEYAQLAVEYNVEHYLLKPISVPKLKQAFLTLREKMESQSTVDDALQYRMDRYNRLVNYEKQQFILDALMGTLQNPKELQKRLELIDFGKSTEQKCLLFELSLTSDETLQHFLSEYGSQELEEQLIHLFQSFDERLDFYLVENYHNRLTGLFWEQPDTGCLTVYQSGEKPLEMLLCDLVQMMTGLSVKFEVATYFSHIKELTQHRKPVRRPETAEAMLHNPEYYHHLREQKKLLMTYIRQGDLLAALPLFESFVRQCLILGVITAQNQLVHFFSIATEKLSEGDTVTFSSLLCDVGVIQVSALKNETELIGWGKEKIRMLVEFLNRQGKISNGSDSIAKIQSYIRENYAKDITLSDAAEQVYLNPIYISRIFKERTGQTFTEYLSQVRIDAAVDFLDHSSRYVYEICELVGYHNLKYFYKVFKKMKGCSPSEYRDKTSETAQASEGGEVMDASF